VFDGTSSVVPLKQEGYVLQWQPEAAKDYPDLYKDPDGYWIASNLYINTPGYNTALVPKGTEPHTYQDLLDPKWRGKIAWNALPSTSGGIGFVGTVLGEMGEQNGRITCAPSPSRRSPMWRPPPARCSIRSSPANTRSRCRFLTTTR
jgi:ABC-type Fe3+ transport system substrate-binding protein